MEGGVDTIFIIIEDWATIHECIHSVWSSEKKAKKEKEKLMTSRRAHPDKYLIEKWAVDE